MILASAEMTRIESYNYCFSKERHMKTQISTKKAIEKLLLGQINCSVCAKLFVREKIGSLRFEEGRHINEDKYFLAQYFMKNEGQISFREDFLYGYYIRSGSASQSVFSSKSLDMTYFSAKLLEDTTHKYPDLVDAAKTHDIVSRLAILKKIIRTGKYKIRKNVINDIKNELLKDYAILPDNLMIINRLEIKCLKIGTGVYFLMVNVFQALKKLHKYKNPFENARTK